MIKKNDQEEIVRLIQDEIKTAKGAIVSAAFVQMKDGAPCDKHVMAIVGTIYDDVFYEFIKKTVIKISKAENMNNNQGGTNE
jgi:hypothetical protein